MNRLAPHQGNPSADAPASERARLCYTDLSLQSEQKYFIGSCDKDALSYTTGETMCFTLSAVTKSGTLVLYPKFKYTFRSDDGSTDEGIVDSVDGSFVYYTSISRPGYVHLCVSACDENGKEQKDCTAFTGGACAGFEEIRQSGTIPEDFDAFWARVIREELDTVAPEVIYKEECRCKDPEDVVYDIRIAAPGENPVSGYLRMPRNAKAKSLPIRVGFMGYSVSSATVPPKGEMIQLNINQHGDPNGHPDKYYQELGNTKYHGFGFDKEQNKNPDTVYFKYMILRALQAFRYCKTLPEWDGVTAIAHGDSMGAFQAASLAALDKDISKADLLVPWMCDLRGGQNGRLRGGSPEADIGLDYYDIVSQAFRITCEVVVTAGLGDYMCPPSGVTALYHNLAGKKSLCMLQNRDHMQGAPECSEYTRT